MYELVRTPEGGITAFRTLTAEGSSAALREEWRSRITPADPETRECGRCRGRGYTRKDLRVGCGTCFGTGRVSNV